MHLGQRGKLRISIWPRDTNMLAVAGLKLTTFMVYWSWVLRFSTKPRVLAIVWTYTRGYDLFKALCMLCVFCQNNSIILRVNQNNIKCQCLKGQVSLWLVHLLEPIQLSSPETVILHIKGVFFFGFFLLFCLFVCFFVCLFVCLFFLASAAVPHIFANQDTFNSATKRLPTPSWPNKYK